MSTYRPKLMEARDAVSRMDALCEFIEFWLGPRQQSYGEPARALRARSLPMPLERLYEFAGRWPSWEDDGPMQYVVPALSRQDGLVALEHLSTEADGKVVFLSENQGNWDCRTLPDGEDPPVWCYGDHVDEHENWFTGEKLVCDSLSRFLVTSVLQELSLGSRLHLFDDGLTARFESQRSRSVPIWTHGPYVHGNDHEFELWGDVLVANLWGDHGFAANHPEGIAFLTDNQGCVTHIGLSMYPSWSLDIGEDGSAEVAHRIAQTKEAAEAPAGTFDFPALLDALTARASKQGHYERDVAFFTRRKGQNSGQFAKFIGDRTWINGLFRLAIDKASRRNKALAKLIESDWPS